MSRKRPKSPIRVGECFPWPFAPKPGERRRRPVCKWICNGTPRGAEFVNRRDSSRTAVLHPSTKRPGTWQISFFDRHGAISDTGGATCSAALDNGGITPSTWKLKAVE